ncbi:MAG: hypothetical protein JW838_08555 [Spirochaetes bacterium]|nr:hypothetical protein [Spirochaetota bacterium]
MGDAFEAQKRYFQIQIERAGARPGLHKNAVADCRLYLKALEETGSPAAFREYVQRTGNMLSSGKAEVKDRYENRLALYEALGSEKKARADRMRLAVIDEAKTHRELAQKLEEVEEKARPLEMAENRAIMAASQVMESLFHLATDPPGSGARERSLVNLREYWRQLKEADPGITFERLVSYPPYRNRMIFTDAQIARLGKVLKEVKDGRNG